MSGRGARRGGPAKRSARAWRDPTHPSGPAPAREGSAPTSNAEPPREADDHVDEHAENPTPNVSPSTTGPGGGGATEWSGRAKHFEGLHGGPSRKP